MTLLPAAGASARSDLTALFDPVSVAIVGASDDPTKYGNWLGRRVLSGPRPAYLVNRSRSTVLGRPAFRSLCDIGEPVDLAVIAVPAAGFESAIDDAISAGVRSVVGITAGLGERGADAKLRQKAMVDRLRSAHITMLGPNCLGVLDNTSRLDLTVNDFPTGSVSIISQSGNVAIDLTEYLVAHDLGVARFASLGNAADLDAADLINSCVDHEGTEAIALYCEGFGDGRKFARVAARAAEFGKPLIVLSVGHGTASARSAASHTGSMVTPTAVLQAVCRAAGCELVSSPKQMADLLQAFLRIRRPSGRRVAVLADGGGHASLASDSLEALGLEVQRFSDGLVAAVAEELPPTAAVSNPIDVAGGGEQDITCFARVLDTLTKSDEYDSVLTTGYFGGYSIYDPAMRAGEIEAAGEVARITDAAGASAVVHTIFAGSEAAQALRRNGVAVYRNVEDAGWALSRVIARGSADAPRVPPLPGPAAPITRSGYWVARDELARWGVPFVEGREVRTYAELREATARLRFPLVLKALGDQHKSDRGGVILRITDGARLDQAWQELQGRLSPPSVSVEQMAELTGAVELIVGVRWDQAFGPIVLVGLGGVYTEVLRDTACALGPLDPDAARQLVLTLDGAVLLTGYRGSAPVDIDAAASIVSRLSHFAAAHPEIHEVECNPVAVTPFGATALDARFVLAG